MGNRAVITTEEAFESGRGTGMYLHWNGGRDSVEGFLTYCKLRGFRPPEADDYGWARLAQVVGNFMGAEGLSVGVGDISRLDTNNWDNGTYLIKGWEIVGRRFFDGMAEQAVYPLREFLSEIDESQPPGQRLGERMMDDLLRNNRTIASVSWCYAHTMESRREKGVVPGGFREGIRYGRGDSAVRIVRRNADTVVVEDSEGKTEECPLFRWTDGCETVICGDGCRERSIDSTEEVLE